MGTKPLATELRSPVGHAISHRNTQTPSLTHVHVHESITLPLCAFSLSLSHTHPSSQHRVHIKRLLHTDIAASLWPQPGASYTALFSGYPTLVGRSCSQKHVPALVTSHSPSGASVTKGFPLPATRSTPSANARVRLAELPNCSEPRLWQSGPQATVMHSQWSDCRAAVCRAGAITRENDLLLAARLKQKSLLTQETREHKRPH